MRYGHARMISFSLSIAKDIKAGELITYIKVVPIHKSTKWIASMGEEMESLNKNQI